ncbi:hypothetical protein FHT03_003822 [Xanthomonas arboricola]
MNGSVITHFGTQSGCRRSAPARNWASPGKPHRARARSYASKNAASQQATSLRTVFLMRCARHARVIFTGYGGVLSHRRGVIAARLTGFHAALRFVPCAPVRSRRGHRGLFACLAGIRQRARGDCSRRPVSDVFCGDGHGHERIGECSYSDNR